MKRSDELLRRMLAAAREEPAPTSEGAPAGFAARVANRWLDRHEERGWLCWRPRLCARLVVGVSVATVLASVVLWPDWPPLEHDEDLNLGTQLHQIAFQP